MQHRNRNGLSALDVVVTIVILLVLAALVLPMVYQQQIGCGTGRTSRCRNNLKQIGLALFNYHEVHRTFPPGWIISEKKNESSGFGWGYQILPFFDQAPLFKKFNPKVPLSDSVSGNDKLAATILTAMRCPSDQGPDQVASRWIPELSTSNYVGNFGIGIPASFSRLAESKGKIADPRYVQGVLGGNTRIRIRDVKDGMSNVVLAGERRLPNSGADWRVGDIQGKFNSYWVGLPNVRSASPLAIVATATGGEFEGTKRDENGNWTHLPLVGNVSDAFTAEGVRRLPLFQINRDVRGMPLETSEGDRPVTAGFSSWHTGGAQVVLGDGTVRFLSENIDPTILTNLMRRSGGETLGDF